MIFNRILACPDDDIIHTDLRKVSKFKAGEGRYKPVESKPSKKHQLFLKVKMTGHESFDEELCQPQQHSEMAVEVHLNKQRIIANIPSLYKVIILYTQLMNVLGSSEENII
jgi:hypothetical protein